jgi:hypothetical protein
MLDDSDFTARLLARVQDVAAWDSGARVSAAFVCHRID